MNFRYHGKIEEYLRVKKCLSEIAPDVSVILMQTDENLMKLGLSSSIPCEFFIITSRKRLHEIRNQCIKYEEIGYDMPENSIEYKNYQRYTWLFDYLPYYDVTEVVAALIWDQDKFMICQRPANKARGMLWEFVGGKVEPGETKEQALVRECQEELAITLSVGKPFMDVVHEYPDLTVHLTLFNAAIASGIPQKLEHNDIRWITVDEIPQYAFCPADQEILKKISCESKKWGRYS